MHSDGEARQFGFTGALVPGVAVFGHMTRPLVEALGAGWFSGHTLKTRSSNRPTTVTNSASSA